MSKRPKDLVRGWHFEIVYSAHGSGYRAELWWNPYDGELVAETRWVSTKRRAMADARKFADLARREAAP